MTEAYRTSVLPATSVAAPYTYLCDMPLPAGTYVRVPLGPRQVFGVVWDTQPDLELETSKLRAVDQSFDLPPMSDEHRQFLQRMADYTMTPLGLALKLSLSATDALPTPKPTTVYTAAVPLKKRPSGLTAQRHSVLDILSTHEPMSASELAEMAGCSAGVVRGMVGSGLLKAEEKTPQITVPDYKFDHNFAPLSDEQNAASDALKDKLLRGFSVTVLDGVTGSGKTEVIFDLIARHLETPDGQILVMMPEIALSTQFFDRFTARFGAPPFSWHSGMTSAQRRKTWRAAALGKARIVVGARSGLFLPFPKLSAIVIDESHDSSYKQEDGVIYHARDMAVLRCQGASIPCILVSATPALETMLNLQTGRYDHLHLPSRHGGAQLPDIQLISLKKTPPERGHWLADPLCAAIEQRLERGEQSLLFLNRRGYAPLTLCRTCGHRIECPHCTSWLVWHERSKSLQCHHCGFHRPRPPVCPECDAEDSFAACGPGVERILEEVSKRFPKSRNMILSGEDSQSPQTLHQQLEAIRKGDVDIIVGTQIIAKGHHFPLLTLVGVVDADLGLSGGDLRAGEKTFHLLEQVSGRAGRSELAGQVMIQTYMPEHRVMQALQQGKRDHFLEIEMGERQLGGWPPYTRLAGIIISGKDEANVRRAAKQLAANIPADPRLQVLGPAPAPLLRLRGKTRWRLLARAPKDFPLQKALNVWLNNAGPLSGVRVAVDIDPQSFL